VPFFYDLEHRSTSSTASLTEVVSPHLTGRCGTNVDPVSIVGMFAAAQFNTVGGGTFRLKDNTSTTTGTTGGTGQSPRPKHPRNPAALSTWNNDASAITAGGTLNTRLGVGFAQTGGMGGYVPIVPQAAVQLLTGSTLAAGVQDLLWTSLAFSTGVTFDWTVEFGEGI
jgi:hypothetical protein